MPGSRVCWGLGNSARRVMEPVLWSTVTSENFRMPGQRVGGAVLQQQFDPGLGAACLS